MIPTNSRLPPVPAFDQALWRGRIPILRRMIPLNNCSQAPLADSVRAAVGAYLDSWDKEGMAWEAWLREVHLAKAEFAALISADPEEVAVCDSVSGAASSIASALDFSSRRCRVLASACEFPTLGHVWLAQKRRGAEVRWLPAAGGVAELEEYREALDEKVCLVSACHGDYQSGALQDVAAIGEMAHDAGAYIFVDAYQTLGARQIDVRALGADFLASGNLKYLMGMPGIAFLYVRRELIDRLEPGLTGWFGRRDPFAFDARRLDWHPSASRFETGTPPLAAAHAARAGMKIIRQVGTAEVQSWIRHLTETTVAGAEGRGLELLGPGDPDLRTPVAAFRCPGSSGAVESALRQRGILASARGPAIRLAPHFFTTEEEVIQALDALVEIFAMQVSGALVEPVS